MCDWREQSESWWWRRRGQTCAIILLLALQLSAVGGNTDWMQDCGDCHCSWNSGKKKADCTSKGFAAIPDNLSNELQVIDFSNNAIPELRRDEFRDTNLNNLHKIFLRNCTIQALNRDALRGLTILIELDMSHNYIRELPAGLFKGPDKLRIVVMNYNEVEVLEDYLFADLHFLSRVEFKHNRLKQVEVNAFGRLSVLSTVYLEANMLSSLRRETFAHTPKLMHLSLAQNPWNCSCELQEFRDFALVNRLYTPPTDCAEPAHLRGKLWNEVPSESFACQPRILGSVRSFIEAQSDNVTLPCRIEGSPRPNVTWAYNKRPINANDYRLRVHNSIEMNRIEPANLLTSELRILGVRASDKGTYTCIADNRGGRAEAEFQLLVNGALYGGGGGGGGDVLLGGDIVGATTSDTPSNVLLVICLIVVAFLLLLIIMVLVICWYCRRIKTYQKDPTTLSENELIAAKLEKTHNASMLEGSVIMEMQKSLLTEVNPVEKPPRRTEFESADMGEEAHDIKKTLLEETQFGRHARDDETQSISFCDNVAARSRHTYVDENYGQSLPPDLLAFPARVTPTSPSMQSSHSNIPEQLIYGIRSPPLTSPVYAAHMTPHGIYGHTTIATATPSGFMTLQHPKARNLALIAAANSRQQQHQQQLQQQQQHQQQLHQLHHQQSPFMQAPVVYAPAAASAVLKQAGSYMTIPRKPRVPSWAPSTNSAAHHTATQLSEFQSPTSPNPSESGTATTAELPSEPVYDNLGLRTTAGGNSTLNLHKATHGEPQLSRYTMRDRPLPATPSLTSVASNSTMLSQSLPLPISAHSSTPITLKTYESLHEPEQQQQHHHQYQQPPQYEAEPHYGTAGQHSGLTLLPIVSDLAPPLPSTLGRPLGAGGNSGEAKATKIPPRPPPKPKKKMSVTTTRSGQGSTSQLFDDEGEDGTEV